MKSSITEYVRERQFFFHFQFLDYLFRKNELFEIDEESILCLWNDKCKRLKPNEMKL